MPQSGKYAADASTPLAAPSADAGSGGARMRVAVTGASGFVGRAVVSALMAGGHQVVRISRAEPRPASGDVRWDPARGLIDPGALEGLDGVVHLAGETIAQRWTAGARRRILESRVQGTALLARTLPALDRPPEVLLSASAIGIYGDRGEEPVDEDSAPGAGFLADVTRAWEAAAAPAREAGIRVVHPRLGVVLGREGGALARLLPPFRLGLGGRVGSGRQWMSWVARTDLVRALLFLLAERRMAGPVNVVAPEPARNAAFTAALGRALHRPTLGFVPAFALRAVYGQMAQETLLGGQYVRPTRLLGAGFRFLHPSLLEALRVELADG